MTDRKRPLRRLALRGLVIKELRQIRRDPRMVPLLMVAPILQLLIFGYAATLDVATARVVILDADHSPESRSLASRVAASSAFELVGHVSNEQGAEEEIAGGRADLAVSIPAGYGHALAGTGSTAVQIVVDGSDSVSASIGLASASGLIARIAREVAEARYAALGARAPPRPPEVSVASRILYNPDLKSRTFMVPGVLAMVLLIVTMIATSMALVREKELGTLEQLIVTPVTRATLLAGKLIPFAIFGIFDILAVLAVAVFWFQIPLRGSVVLLLGNAFPFLLCTLGLGLLVSTISQTQQQAMMTAMFLVMLPMIYLSGFVFPIESMPKVVQPLTELMPLTHFLVIIRGVMLKGAGWRELWPEITKLSALGVGIFGLAIALFRKRLD